MHLKNENKNKNKNNFSHSIQEQEVLLTCFQSEDGKSKEIPLEIMYTNDISINCSKVCGLKFHTMCKEFDDFRN